jgi:hypothetical protein
MRMHAQTAMIENGFVHLPKEAGWLAEYLHELSAFPRGRHDDQVDSTAQMLDWFKQAGSGPSPSAGIWHLYRQQYEAQQAAASQMPKPEPLSVMARRLLEGRRSYRLSTSPLKRAAPENGSIPPFADTRSEPSMGRDVPKNPLSRGDT